MTTAEVVFYAHAKFAKRFDQRIRDLLLRKFKELTETEAKQLIQLCEDPLTPVNMTVIGLCHQHGKGVRKDAAEAVAWYQRSADAGDHTGMEHLGTCYRDGIGIAMNETQALEWFKRSAELGNADAMHHLGDYYNSLRFRMIFDGAEPDRSEALRQATHWYSKSASLGNASAMCNFGIHLYAYGTDTDEEEAIEWFRLSAQLGNPKAMYQLGNHHEQGLGVARDIAQAIEWYRKSADLGVKDAMEALGTCYAEGLGVERDVDLAIEWFRRAVQSTEDTDWLYSEAEGTLEALLLKHKGLIPAVDYYLDMYDSCAPGNKRDSYKETIFRLVSQDDIMGIMRDRHRLEKVNRDQATQVEALNAENERLRTELDYQPGGIGFHRAMDDFGTKLGRLPRHADVVIDS